MKTYKVKKSEMLKEHKRIIPKLKKAGLTKEASCHRLKTVMCGEHNGIAYIPEMQGIIKENAL